MFSYLRRVLDLTEVSMKKYILIVICISFSGILDASTIALIPIVIAVAFNGEERYLDFFLSLGIPEDNILTSVLVLLLLVAITKVIFSLGVQYFVIHFISYKQVEVTEKIVSSFLSLRYLDYVKHDPNQLIKTVVSSVPRFIEEGLHSSIRIMNEFIVFILIVATLFWVNMKVSLILFGAVFVLGALFVFLTKKYALSFSNKMLDAQSGIIEFARIAIDGFVESKIQKLQSFFLSGIRKNTEQFAKTGAKFYVVQAFPRYILEFIIILAFLVGAGFAVKQNLDLVSVSAVAGAFGLGAVRLIPVTNNIVNFLNKIRFSQPILDEISEIMLILEKEAYVDESEGVKLKQLEDVDSIELDAVSFAYSNNVKVVDNLSLECKKGELTGIIGPSGTGKSTALRILLGLIKPDQGRVLLNKRDVYEEKIFWPNNDLIYIPQDSFILSTSFAENVALGESQRELQVAKVNEALKLTGLSDAINDFPEGILHPAGDNGRNLSGGQKHRLSISRAFYFGKKVIVLDEPTAALDKATSKEIMKALKIFAKDRIIVMVTHDYEAMEYCDNLIDLGADNVES